MLDTELKWRMKTEMKKMVMMKVMVIYFPNKDISSHEWYSAIQPVDWATKYERGDKGLIIDDVRLLQEI